MSAEKIEMTAEEIVERVLAIAQEKSGLTWSQAALDDLRAAFGPSIAQRLKAGKWREEGGNVWRAAEELGRVAASVARLHKQPRVEEHAAVAARNLIAEHCQLAYGEGRYCNMG